MTGSGTYIVSFSGYPREALDAGPDPADFGTHSPNFVGREQGGVAA